MEDKKKITKGEHDVVRCNFCQAITTVENIKKKTKCVQCTGTEGTVLYMSSLFKC